jgi:hypothetical protein
MNKFMGANNSQFMMMAQNSRFRIFRQRPDVWAIKEGSLAYSITVTSRVFIRVNTLTRSWNAKEFNFA